MSHAGIIFDFDGTLVHTLPDLVDAVNFGLKHFDLPPASDDQVRNWVGDGMLALSDRALRGTTGTSAEQLAEKISAYYSQHRLDKVTLFPGVAQALDTLAASQIPMAILSNKPHEHTAPMVKHLLSRWRFLAVEGCREHTHRKPDPRIASDIAKRMGLPPDHIFLVGDSGPDIQTARNAGMIPVGVTWGYRHPQELMDTGAKYMIHSPQELHALVSSVRTAL